MSVLTHCPSCGSNPLRPFYEVRGVPSHSVLMHRYRDEAIGYPPGDIVLGVCGTCGFIANLTHDPSLQAYSTRYESTQACSPTFSRFARRTAEDLVDRHGLRGKIILEIGCGQGEFLSELCALGNNRGVGFDPAYSPERSAAPEGADITFVQDYYSAAYQEYDADFVCCKMTLEHIPDTADFVRTVQYACRSDGETVVFFQVPDVSRILTDQAFWDIYYEHCSYFSPGSLARLFRRAGFRVLDLYRAYDEQYLMVEATSNDRIQESPHPLEEPVDRLLDDVRYFEARIPHTLDRWRGWLRATHAAGDRVAIWGGGSKGVAFLTTLGIQEEVAYAVDINPLKRGTFLAGTGHEILGPDDLGTAPPDIVVVMNPIYCQEIQQALERRGIAAHLVRVDEPPEVP